VHDPALHIMDGVVCLYHADIPFVAKKLKFVFLLPKATKSLWFLKNRSSELMEFEGF